MVEHEPVALGAAGSNPVSLVTAIVVFGTSPSGKAVDFDSTMQRFDPFCPNQIIKFTENGYPYPSRWR